MKNRIGVVGGGQLARMLAYDAKKMGFTFTVLDPTPNSPASQVCDEQIVAPLDDELAMRKLAEKSDYLTVEWELANDKLLQRFSEQGVLVNPSAKTLGIIKDKLKQKHFLRDHGLPVGDFFEVTKIDDIKKLGSKIGYPMLLKARHDAYDGRGNVVIENEQAVAEALHKLDGKQLYVEKFVYFVKELSVMVARSLNGEIKCFPVVENIHKNNILHMTMAPAQIDDALMHQATDVATRTMQHLLGAGVFGIELFLTNDNMIYINEIAPRVHNSGHYTIEACYTSQFEQHIRAVTGLPLGRTDMIVPSAVMINILGGRTGEVSVHGLEQALGVAGVTVHIYGKAEVRPDRKMGHITAIGKDMEAVKENAMEARKYVSI